MPSTVCSWVMLFGFALLPTILTTRCGAQITPSGVSSGSPYSASGSGPASPTSGTTSSSPEISLPATSPGGSASPAADTVVEVRVVGNETISTAKILDQVDTRAGRPFDPQRIQKDVRRLASRRWFLDVEPRYKRVPGGVLVIFKVTERSTLRWVEYLGNVKVKDKTLAKQTDLKVGGPVDPYAADEGRRKIEDYYHEQGFNNVQVTVREGNKVTDRGVTYEITEGRQESVLWVKFVGNTVVSDARLKTQILTKPGIMWLFKGKVDRQKIEEDCDRLTSYYRNLGYFHARARRELEFSESGWATITFVIDEGPRSVIRSVSFMGNNKFVTDQLAADLKLKASEYFDGTKLNEDLNTLKDFYGSRGYVTADVKVNPRFLEEDPRQLDLVYNIEEGQRYRVGEIRVNITGEHPHTQIKTVLNRLSVKPGDIANITKIRQDERRIRASQLFEHNPAQGISPKIVFQLPDSALESVAERPRGSSGFRGQSPDNAASGNNGAERPAGVVGHRAQYRPGDEPDARLDIVISGQLKQPNRAAAAPQAAPAVQRGQQRVPVPPNESQRPTTSPAGAPPSGQPASGTPSPGTPPPSAWIIRGQSPETNSWRAQSPYGGYAVQPVSPGDQATPLSIYNRAPPQQKPAAQTSASYPSSYAQPTQPGYPANTAAYQAGVTRYPTSTAGYQANAAGSAVSTASYPSSTSGSSAYATNTVPPPSPYTTYQPVAPPANNRPIFPGPPLSAPGAVANGDPELIVPDLMPEPLIGAPTDPTIPLIVEGLQEAQTGRFMAGVGVNSDSGLTGQITIHERNFDWQRYPRSFEDIVAGRAWRGGGQDFRIELMPGTEVQRYLVSFSQPYLWDTPIMFRGSGYYYDRRYRDWDEQRVGGGASLGYQLAPDLSTVFTYRGENVRISDPRVPTPPELAEVVGNNVLHGFKGSLVHDTRDNAFLPTSGHMIELSFEQVVGTYDYPRGEVDVRQYYLVRQRPDGSGSHVVSLSGRVGVTGDNTPIYDNYFAGGFSTLRGWDFRGASPVVDNVIVGGEFMLLGSAEYLLPITADDMIRGVIFCDFGTVEPDVEINRFRVAPGFGFRITVPAMGPAPIALDFAFPIVKAATDDTQIFSFTVGFFRQ